MASSAKIAAWVAAAAVFAACQSHPAGPTATQTTTASKANAEFACLSGSASPQGSGLLCAAVPALNLVATGEPVKLGSTLTLEIAGVAVGELVDTAIELRNVAAYANAAALRIESVALDSIEDQAGGQFECLQADKKTPCEKGGWQDLVPAGAPLHGNQATSTVLWLRFHKDDAAHHWAWVSLTLRGVSPPKDATGFTIATALDPPKVTVMPADGLSFPYLELGKQATQTFVLANQGKGALRLDGLDLTLLPEAFSVSALAPNAAKDAAAKGGAKWLFAAPLKIAAGSAAEFSLTFAPTDDKKQTGKILFIGNDPAMPSVHVEGNAAIPAMLVEPAGKYDFPGAVPGGTPKEQQFTIRSAGSAPLVITSIGFAAPPPPLYEFSIDQSPLAANLKAPPPVSAANPLVLLPGEQAAFKVLYTPNDITDEAGPPDSADIVFKTNGFLSPTLHVTGSGIKVKCPIAKASLAEKSPVPPKTVLHLTSAGSAAFNGNTITKYAWTVEPLDGPNQVPTPIGTDALATYVATAPGVFGICLDVWDSAGIKSCVPSCAGVEVKQ